MTGFPTAPPGLFMDDGHQPVAHGYGVRPDSGAPVALWPVWDGAGSGMGEIAQGHDATLQNMDNTDWIHADEGFRLELDGTLDYIAASAPTLKDPNVFTMASWVLATDVGNRQTIWGRENVNNAPQLEFRGAGSDAIAIAEPGTFVAVSTINMVFDNTWHNVVYRRWGDQAGEQEIWVDGVDVGLSTDVAHTFVNSPTLNFGRRAAASQLLIGQLGQQILFDRAIETEEIPELYLKPFMWIRPGEQVVVPVTVAAGQPTMRRWGGVRHMTPGPRHLGRRF